MGLDFYLLLARVLLTIPRRQIIDDGFKHSLIVYEDAQTKGIRLHAAVWEGELRQCPVWTAFGAYPFNPPLPRSLRLRISPYLFPFTMTSQHTNFKLTS